MTRAEGVVKLVQMAKEIGALQELMGSSPSHKARMELEFMKWDAQRLARRLGLTVGAGDDNPHQVARALGRRIREGG